MVLNLSLNISKILMPQSLWHVILIIQKVNFYYSKSKHGGSLKGDQLQALNKLSKRTWKRKIRKLNFHLKKCTILHHRRRISTLTVLNSFFFLFFFFADVFTLWNRWKSKGIFENSNVKKTLSWIDLLRTEISFLLIYFTILLNFEN